MAVQAQPRTPLPASLDYTSPTIGILKYVPAGSFQRDATATNISHQSAFRMSQYEITRAQFLAIMGSDPSDTTFSSGTSDPVQMVNWYQAIAFCNKLSLLEGLQPAYSVKIGGTTEVDWANLSFASIPTTSNADWNAATCTWTATGYRLPTEMQWMWAAMGATADSSNGYTGTGVNTKGYTKGYAGSTESGNAQTNIGNYAWYDTNSSSKTHPVGTNTANELGIYDLSGNVWEWCWDWYAAYPAGEQTDYVGAATGATRVVRGGSWSDNASYCTVAAPSINDPYSQGNTFGFRVVRP